MPRKSSSSRVPRKTPDVAPRTHALSLLRADHNEVGRLSREYQVLMKGHARVAIRRALAREICQKLNVHARIEEEIFYPALRGTPPNASLLHHADVEHGVAKALIQRIERCKGGESHFDALVGVLCEYVAHHAREEEGEIFAKAREAGIDLWALGARMAVRQTALLRQGR